MTEMGTHADDQVVKNVLVDLTSKEKLRRSDCVHLLYIQGHCVFTSLLQIILTSKRFKSKSGRSK